MGEGVFLQECTELRTVVGAGRVGKKISYHLRTLLLAKVFCAGDITEGCCPVACVRSRWRQRILFHKAFFIGIAC